MKYFLLTLILFPLSLFAQLFEQTAGITGGGAAEAIMAYDNIVLTSVNNQFFRSDDGGESFELTLVNGEDMVTPRCFARINDVLVMGAINSDRIYRSTDDGLTWEIANQGMPLIFGFPAAVPIEADTLDGDFYMCGTNFLRKSEDLGLTWEIMDIDGLTLDVSSTGGKMWATPGGNLHCTSDNGVTWDNVPDEGLFFSNSGEDVLESEGRIFVTTSLSAGNGLYVSDNGGLTYQLNGDFSIGNTIKKINDDLYLTHFGGFSKSSDNGETWSNLEVPYSFVGYSGDFCFDGNQTIWLTSGEALIKYDINDESYETIALSTGNVGQVTSSGNLSAGIQNGQAVISTNFGNTWTSLNEVIGEEDFQAVDVFLDNQEVYVSGIINAINAVVYQSMDGGLTFDQLILPDGFNSILEILSVNPVVVAGNQGLAVSLDNGTTFQVADLKFLDDSDAPDNQIFDELALNDGGIYACGQSGMAYSFDNGVSWKFIEETNVKQLNGWQGRLVKNKQESFPAFQTYESSDGGASWTPITGIESQFSGPSYMWVKEDTLFVQNDFTNAAAGEFNHLTEEASEWSSTEWMGSFNDQIISASYSQQGLLLGTQNTGAWKISSNSGSTSVNSIDANDVMVYPNPTRGDLFVKGLSRSHDRVSLKDISGKTVLTVDSKTNFRQPLKLNELQAGIYILEVESLGEAFSFRIVKE